MADVATAAKLRFLNASAHHYSTSAPATSAHLMLQRNLELADNGLVLREEEGDGSCRACGSILIPGRTSRTSIVSGEVSKSKARSKKHRGEREVEKPIKFVKTDCLVCHRFEKKPLQRPTDSSIKKSGKATAQPTPLTVTRAGVTDPASSQSLKPATTNASSKQRAKARKHGGLFDPFLRFWAGSFGLDETVLTSVAFDCTGLIQPQRPSPALRSEKEYASSIPGIRVFGRRLGSPPDLASDEVLADGSRQAEQDHTIVPRPAWR